MEDGRAGDRAPVVGQRAAGDRSRAAVGGVGFGCVEPAASLAASDEPGGRGARLRGSPPHRLGSEVDRGRRRSAALDDAAGSALRRSMTTSAPRPSSRSSRMPWPSTSAKASRSAGSSPTTRGSTRRTARSQSCSPAAASSTGPPGPTGRAPKRQGRALPPDDGSRMGLRPDLQLKHRPPPRPATLARALQRAQATQRPRRPVTHQPRSQPLQAGHLVPETCRPITGDARRSARTEAPTSRDF